MDVTWNGTEVRRKEERSAGKARDRDGKGSNGRTEDRRGRRRVGEKARQKRKP